MENIYIKYIWNTNIKMSVLFYIKKWWCIGKFEEFGNCKESERLQLATFKLSDNYLVLTIWINFIWFTFSNHSLSIELN